VDQVETVGDSASPASHMLLYGYSRRSTTRVSFVIATFPTFLTASLFTGDALPTPYSLYRRDLCISPVVTCISRLMTHILAGPEFRLPASEQPLHCPHNPDFR
jgi:hypothetical protein